MSDVQSTITTSMGVTAASIYLGSIAARRPTTIKPAVGVVVAGTILLIGAQGKNTAPLAGKFAVLIATTAVLTSGYVALSAVGRYLSAGDKQPTRTGSGLTRFS